MQELIVNIAPNLASKLPDFYKALGDTMLMVLWSGLISFVFGLLLGVVLTVTKPNGILENKVVYQILDKLVSLFRSIPFIILLTWVMPITRALVGTVLYVRGAIVPLVFGSVPFFTRQVESALAELDGGLIEAALSMGSSPLEIIFRVYLKESIAAIARGTTITIVSLLNLTAMAGKGIPTGFRLLDTVLTGLGRGDLIILAARPGMGTVCQGRVRRISCLP